MSINESTLADTWLYATLHGDATLMALITGVYADIAPLNATFPHVVFALQDAPEIQSINGTTILVAGTYLVKIVGEGPSYTALDPAYSRVHALLHRQHSSSASGYVYGCAREEIVRYAETVDGKQYRHLGGLYSLVLQSI
jgi:hypothetical protein